MRNGIILKLPIIPNRNLHIINFQMTYNVAVCTVGTFKLLKNNAFLLFGRSTIKTHIFSKADAVKI